MTEETKGLIKFELDEEHFRMLSILAEKEGIRPGELVARLFRREAEAQGVETGKPDVPDEKPVEKKRHLIIMAEVPEKWAAALEYGPGILETWTEESLGCCLEGDFDGGRWSKDVEKYFGVKSADARDAFDVYEARFVGGGIADKARKLLYDAPNEREEA
jgi:hypothetical protein